MEQRLDGGDKWWSGFSFTTSKTADLGGVVQWGFGVRCKEMDSRRRRTLSGVMVASMAERPSKVGALVFALKMDWWKMAATTHESASDRCIPQTQYVAWLGPPVLDVRHLCDVCLVLGSDYRHTFIKWIEIVTYVARMVASDYLMYYFVRSMNN